MLPGEPSGTFAGKSNFTPSRRAIAGPSGFPPCCPLPRPSSLDFHLQREAEERPDQHDTGKNGQAADSWLHRNGVDDVGRDKELEPEQNGLAEAGAKARD